MSGQANSVFRPKTESMMTPAPPAPGPATEAVRGLLMGTRIGGNAIITIAWSAGIAVLAYGWARKLYSRDPVW
jgi:hypothetical protein